MTSRVYRTFAQFQDANKNYPRYMMGTDAMSGGTPQMNISRDEPDLCVIDKDDATLDCFVGAWCSGFGFVHVRFPHHTTRDLTQAEFESFERKVLQGPQGQLWPALAPFTEESHVQ